jgi:hypothetical protein
MPIAEGPPETSGTVHRASASNVKVNSQIDERLANETEDVSMVSTNLSKSCRKGSSVEIYGGKPKWQRKIIIIQTLAIVTRSTMLLFVRARFWHQWSSTTISNHT